MTIHSHVSGRTRSTSQAGATPTDPPVDTPRVQAQAAKTLLAVDRRLGRRSDPRVVELAKGAR